MFVARKLGAPNQPELGIGAIASGGVRAINENLKLRLDLTTEEVDAIAAIESVELERRVREYRGHSPEIDLGGKEVILVDDGLATGYTALAALRSLRQMNPQRLTVVAPVCSVPGANLIESEADEVHFLLRDERMESVASYYSRFDQLDDDDVHRILAENRRGVDTNS